MKKARHTKARITRFQFTFTLGISFGIKVIISTTVAFENKTIASFQKTKRPLKHENITNKKFPTYPLMAARAERIGDKHVGVDVGV